MRASLLVPVGLLAALSACGGGFGAVDLPDEPPEHLSELQLVRVDDGELLLNDRVEPYTLNTPLFSDYALKERHLYVPEGQVAEADPRWTYRLPVGSAILKTFLVAPDLREPDVDATRIETRVLVNSDEGWLAWPYIWDEDGQDATYAPSGMTEPMTVIDRDGTERAFTYLVPQKNQCQECHEIEDTSTGEKGIVPIGPTTRNMDQDGQLERLVQAGLIADPGSDRPRPAVDWKAVLDSDWSTVSDEELDQTARDYLDVNCAHCHNERATNGVTSQLFLSWDNEDQFRLGVCKKPGSAAKGTGGRSWDIVPGDPDQSILHYRMQTDDVGSMMPDIGRSLVHDEGVALIAEWIRRMPGEPCEE